MRIETRRLSELKDAEHNSRTHDGKQVEQIANSIQEFGWTNPILIDEDGGIIAGHGRKMAAERLGIDEAPCVVLSGLSEAQKRAYLIADNQLPLNAGWDLDVLRGEVEAILSEGFDINLLGFDSAFLDELLIDATAATEDAQDDPPDPGPPVTVPGDIWQLGDHRVMCGDSTAADDVAALIGDGVTPTLMVTDPPYGVEYDPAFRADAGKNKNRGKMGTVLNDDRADWYDAWVLFPGRVAYVWHADAKSHEVVDSMLRAEFEIRAKIIWVKDRFALSRGDYHWKHEPCLYAVKKGEKRYWCGSRSETTVWEIKSRDDSGHGHGTQKPVECMARPIRNSSERGDAIYDPFCGSGTTIIAAERTGRKCYAMELSPEYVDIIVRRWQAETGRQAVNANTGAPFDDRASS